MIQIRQEENRYMDIIEIGQFIGEQRKKLGYTQQQLGEQLGVSNKAVSKWERGVSQS